MEKATTKCVCLLFSALLSQNFFIPALSTTPEAHTHHHHTSDSVHDSKCHCSPPPSLVYSPPPPPPNCDPSPHHGGHRGGGGGGHGGGSGGGSGGGYLPPPSPPGGGSPTTTPPTIPVITPTTPPTPDPSAPATPTPPYSTPTTPPTPDPATPTPTPPYSAPAAPPTPDVSAPAPPTPPFQPDPNATITGTCDFWRNHPTMVWRLVGWWATVGGAFGTSSIPASGGGLNLFEALSNTSTDGHGALYREGTASLLNSMANRKFHFTTAQVRGAFSAALRSDRAAAAQARIFKQANEGHLKPTA